MSTHRQRKLTMRVTCGTILRNGKMAVNIQGHPTTVFCKYLFDEANIA